MNSAQKLTKIFIFFIVFLGLFFSSKAHAQEFTTEYNVEYVISDDGTTNVTQNISIINLQKDVIATNYSLNIDQMSVFDITAIEDGEQIEPTITKKDGKTEIYVEFEDFVIGKNKRKNFIIQYQTNDIASKVGKVWNVNIPRINNLGTTQIYDVKLTVPQSFGPLLHISPAPLTVEDVSNGTTYFFNKILLNNNGINAAFGEYQVLNFRLNYILENESVFNKKMELALPPDVLGSQQIFYSEINPKPEKVYIDQDGNYMATYTVDSKSSLEITTVGSVKISGNQINPQFGGYLNDIPNDLTNLYTQPQRYWEVNSDAVQKVAQDLYEEEFTVSQNAQKIYNYITQNLSYDFELEEKDFVERNGALKALQSEGQWACMEFTDLFIALSRAMGIPAREINGYAFAGEGQNQPLSIRFRSGDVLHAWPQFYDPEFGWVAIDPTWGATSGLDYFTKLDTNHFAFVVKGVDSEYPLPAGAYKITGEEQQVDVTFALNGEKLDETQSLQLYQAVNLNPINHFTDKITVVALNTGKSTLFNVNNQNITLPPFSSTLITINKNAEEIFYMDFNGNQRTAAAEYHSIKLPNSMSNSNSTPIHYLVIIVLALVLCTIVYLFAVHSNYLKKQLAHLRHRLRDQDQ